MSSQSLTEQFVALNETTKLLKEELNYVKFNNDSFFLVTMGCIIFLMQCGFAFLEAGSVRSKNTTNILIKNLLDSCDKFESPSERKGGFETGISAICYWAVGWGLAYGKDAAGILGTSEFGMVGLDDAKYPTWFFQLTFAATAATIVSGALAERCEFIAYFAYCALLTGFVYPIITHWAWDPSGWLAGLGYKDFAGSGVVHLHGATCALIGAIVLGPRIGRFKRTLLPKEVILGHSVPFTALGGFILMFGFFAFNGGSQASISVDGDGRVVARAMINTMMSGAAATLTVIIVERIRHKWSMLKAINAVLTGMVTACAGCDAMEPWCALIAGVGAGLSYLFVSWVMVKCRVDDPVDAVAVHGGGGFWGLFITPIIMNGGIAWNISNQDTWKILGVNMLGAVAIISWSLLIIGSLFLILRLLKVFRVSAEVERKGLDIKKHGEPAYPLAAYGHGWTDYAGETNSDIARQAPIGGYLGGAPVKGPLRSPTPPAHPAMPQYGSWSRLHPVYYGAHSYVAPSAAEHYETMKRRSNAGSNVF